MQIEGMLDDGEGFRIPSKNSKQLPQSLKGHGVYGFGVRKPQSGVSEQHGGQHSRSVYIIFY